MNRLNDYNSQAAQRQAILNTYSYIAYKYEVDEGESFQEIINGFEDSRKLEEWSDVEIEQLNILNKALVNDPSIGALQIGNPISEQNGEGMNACTFVEPDTPNVYVVFRGTGKGEWIDNGEGLSGVPEENIYYEYNASGKIIGRESVKEDYASNQQVKAINWFNKTCEENGWTSEMHITVSGHSKGGNKAQFVTINSDLVDECYSFDGQGFSPEAVNSFKEKYESEYDDRRNRIFSISADNDYVNVLGERLAPESQIYYIDSPMGDNKFIDYHNIHAILNEEGKINQQTNQGEISEFLEHTSHDIMKLEPEVRKHATDGLMAILQQERGKGAKPVNGDFVSFPEKIIGVLLTIDILILHKEEIKELFLDMINLQKDDLIIALEKKLNEIGIKYGSVLLKAYVTVLVVTSIVMIRLSNEFKYQMSKLNDVIALLEATLIIMKCHLDVYGHVYTVLKGLIDSFNEWCDKNFNDGFQYATANPTIQINTDLLCQYAERLLRITHEINNVDRQISALYSKVKIADLFKLLQADLMLGYNWKINSCINYLNGSASDFENVERNICSQL